MCGAGSPFDGTAAPDEFGLLAELGPDELERRLERHRASYVTEETFGRLASLGVGLLRVPVPYWLFGTDHHRACVGCLDWAVDRAAAHGMRVLVDLHTVPGGQNASDNGGVCGLCTWHLRPDKVEEVLDTLGRIALRYAGHPGLFGIEPLNEPANEVVFSVNARRFGARFPDRVAASQAVPRGFLEQFYLQAYERVRPATELGATLVLHDRFDPLVSWDAFMPRDQYNNVWLDTHRYLVFSGHLLKGSTSRGRLASHRRLARAWGREIARARRHHGVLVGEWCLSNLVTGAGGAGVGKDARDARDRAAQKRGTMMRALADMQLKAWSKGSGSCFWNLRNEAPGSDPWSFEASVANGWLWG